MRRQKWRKRKEQRVAHGPRGQERRVVQGGEGASQTPSVAKTEKYPRILATWGSLVALVTLGEGSMAGEEKCRAAKGRRRLGNGDDSYQGFGVPRETSKGMDPQPP